MLRRALTAVIVPAAIVLPHVAFGDDAAPQRRAPVRAPVASPAEVARHTCEVRFRRVLPAAAAALAAQVALSACGAGGDVATVRPWVSQALYLPPPEPLATPTVTAAAPATPAVKAPVKARARPAAVPDDTGAPSDAEVAAELRQAYKGSGGGRDIVDAATLTTGDLATVPVTAPGRVNAIINAANAVARKPYVYGGGHGGGPEGIFTDSAYDCSGSISYALAAAGFIDSPMDSSSLARFGKPGPGKWVTIYANAGHAFMYVAGLRFDTSGRSTSGSRWQVASRPVGGFTVRHPAGL